MDPGWYFKNKEVIRIGSVSGLGWESVTVPLQWFQSWLVEQDKWERFMGGWDGALRVFFPPIPWDCLLISGVPITGTKRSKGPVS